MVRPVSLKDVELPKLRCRAATLVEDSRFVRLITALILINAVTLGMETDPDIFQAYGYYLRGFDIFVLTVFVVEIGLKLFAYRFQFFKVGWNVFDFVIVGISLIPASSGLAIFRSLRVLRVFRLITLVPQMRRVIGALFHAIPGMASIIGVLLVIIYVAAVVATKIFGAHLDPVLQGYFGSVSHSMYSMFQLMTLEDWPDIANPTMVHFPWAWAFFIPYILITSFAVLNLFIGIIVDALHIVKEDDLKEEEAEQTKELSSEIGEVKAQLDDLQKDMKKIVQHIKRG